MHLKRTLLTQMVKTSLQFSFFKQLEYFIVKFQKYVLVKCGTFNSERDKVFFSKSLSCFSSFLLLKCRRTYVSDISDF